MQFYGFVIDVVEDIEQISDIETDVESLAAIFNLAFFLGFFLFGITGNDLETTGAEHEAYAAELLVGEDRCPQQGMQQGIARQLDQLAVMLWNDPFIVRELAVDQFGNQLDAAETETGLGWGQCDFKRIVVVGQFDQLIAA